MEEERCDSHRGPGRSCGGKIRFSPPPPVSSAEASAVAGVRRYMDDRDAQGDEGGQRYLGNGDGWSDGEYLFRRPRG